MADTLARLAGPVALSDTPSTVYTVPVSTITTVTSIHVANENPVADLNSIGPAFLFLSVGSAAPGAHFFAYYPVMQADSFDWAGTLVLEAGEVLQAYADVEDVLVLTISGVETDL